MGEREDKRRGGDGEWTYESEKTPGSGWASCGLAVVRGGGRDGVDEPGALEETVDALLAHELEGFFVQFLAEIAVECARVSDMV